MYWQENHIDEALFMTRAYFHDVKFKEMSDTEKKMWLAMIAQYAKEIAEYAESWKADIEFNEKPC